MLTQKQEKFIQGILQGMTQAQAYRSAYETENMSDASVYSEASRLVRKAAVRQRLEQLQEELEGEGIASARERLELLTQIIRGERSVSDKLKAVDLMNKMTGGYLQKPEPEVDRDVTVRVELRD